MSRRRLPPLNALRAFEAAARHLNFEKAGDEIAVTASAVGQQVKSLEAWLGRPLFLRQPSRGVVLTPLGEHYAASLSDILDRLDDATAQALRSDRSNVITVSSMPSFAAGWLIPRLGSLESAASGSGGAGLGRYAADGFRSRGRGRGDPLRAGKLSGPALGPADGGILSSPSAAHP